MHRDLVVFIIANLRCDRQPGLSEQETWRNAKEHVFREADANR